MVDVAKWLTHRIVAPAFVGSIPIIHPYTTTYIVYNIGVSPSGKATGFGPVIQGFESLYPIHELNFKHKFDCREVEQWLARRAHNPKVGSSNLPFATKTYP